MNFVRIRTQLESTTLSAPELGAFLGKRVEIIVLEEEPQVSPLLATRGIFAPDESIPGDPVADALSELRVERARLLEATIGELRWPSS